jgi:uncharacterized membrane protein
MVRPILFAVLFAVIGLVLFALLAPLLFSGANMEKLGAAVAPLILPIFGGAGFFFGLRRK